MAHDDRVYVGHMLDMCRKAADKIRHKSRPEFDADEDLQMVLAHIIQMIGEAAARVSPITRSSHPGVPWTQIVAMRHRIVHDYMNVDYDIVWDVAVNKLPPLIEILRQIVENDASPS